MYRCIASDKKFLKLYDTNIKDILSKIEVENIKLKEFSNNFDKKIKIIKRNINNIKKDIQCFEESIENYEFNMDVFEKKINKIEKLYKTCEKAKSNISHSSKEESLEIVDTYSDDEDSDYVDEN